MLVLAIETATGVESVSLNTEGLILSEINIDDGNNHSTGLMKNVAKILKSAGKNISEVDAIAVSAGPGSFTGLRVGFSLAKGLSFTAKKPFITVPTLDALAWSYAPAQKGIVGGKKILAKGKTLLCSVLDARRSEFYFSAYVKKGETLYKLQKDKALPLKAMCEVLKDLKAKDVVFVGDGVSQCKAELEKFLPESSFAGTFPRASGVGGLALIALSKGDVSDFATAFPFYVRKPDAVVKKQKKEGKQTKQ